MLQNTNNELPKTAIQQAGEEEITYIIYKIDLFLFPTNRFKNGTQTWFEQQVKTK